MRTISRLFRTAAPRDSRASGGLSGAGKLLRLVATCLLALLCTRLAVASGAPISARLSAYRIQLGQTATLTVTLEGGTSGYTRPELPRVPNATLQLTGQSSSFVMNGISTNLSQQFSYTISPRRTGNIVIGPIYAIIDGQRYSTRSMTLQVVPASPNSSPQQVARPGQSPGFTFPTPRGLSFGPPSFQAQQQGHMFVRARVTPGTIYQNQTLIYHMEFYHAGAVDSDVRYDPMAPTGFLRVKLPQRDHIAHIDGLNYEVDEIRTALFALTPGRYTLGPTRLQVAQLFGFGGRILRTRAITIHVLPLPTKGTPDDFSGAVGHFTMRAALDTSTATVGSPVTLKVTVRGDGDVDLIPSLKLPKMPGFSVYNTTGKGKTVASGDTVLGTKTFSTVLVPRTPGDKVISGIRFCYFDPSQQRYRTVTAPDLEVHVTPGTTPQPTSTAGASPAPEPGHSPVPQPGLRPIHTGVSLRRPSHLLESPVFLGLQFVPLIALGAVFGLPALGRLWRHTAHRMRHARPLDKALRELGQGEDPSRIVHGYLFSKLGTRTTGLSYRQLQSVLERAGVDAGTRTELTAALEQADQVRYAPAGAAGTPEDVEQRARNVLRKLEERL